MKLPLYQTDDDTLQLWQTKWKSLLDPILANPLLSGRLLENVALTNGVSVINHGLQRKPVGWWIVDTTAGVVAYRSAPFNELTLTLTSTANATAKIWIF